MRVSYSQLDGTSAVVDANGNVGIANTGFYYTEQTNTPALDIALYSSATTPMYYFVSKNAPSTNYLQVYPGYNTVYNSGGTTVTNAAYVATNKYGNVAYVDLSGGLHYSGNTFGAGQAFTTVLSSGVMRVALSPTRLWYIDTNRDAWYANLATLSTLIQTSGTSCYEISAGGDETAAVSVDPGQNYAVFLYDRTNPSPPADGQFTKKVPTSSIPNGALDIGIYDSSDGIYIDPPSKDVVFTNSF